MDECGVPLDKGKNIEEWLEDQPPASFPNFSATKGEKSYPVRYKDLKIALLPIHENVEKGAMAAGAIEWMKQSVDIINEIEDNNERKNALRKLIESDPIIYLNNHGPGHVDKVIGKVSEMLHFFDRSHLTPYEGFLLLCAIQAHDIGNVFGRVDHEKRCQEILEDKGKPFIRDGIERKVIEKLALVHGGAIGGERDTIAMLSESKQLNDRKIRKKLLAALLRFGDELADDSSRADREGLEMGTILEGSRIYHQYSQSLHTVMIDRDSVNGRVQLNLSYEFDTTVAKQKFMKNGKKKYLLDEIYDRTLKMERERRYCMRFTRPSFSLDAIRVEIIIQHAKNAFKSDKIRYTLEENGYPSDPASGHIKKFLPDIKSGKEQMQYLTTEWSLS